MNWNKLAAASFFAVLNVAAFAAHADVKTTAPVAASASTLKGDPFGALKHVNAGLLNVAYAEVGPADGPVVILLHGWPYDIHSYSEVAPLLAAKGYRVLIP
jgi:hypothetical protein